MWSCRTLPLDRICETGLADLKLKVLLILVTVLHCGEPKREGLATKNPARSLPHCLYHHPSYLTTLLSLLGHGSEARCSSAWLQGALCPSASAPELPWAQQWLLVPAGHSSAFPGTRPAYWLHSWCLNNDMEFKVPLRTLSTSSDMAPGSFGVLHLNTF